jgi:hypothetical protein
VRVIISKLDEKKRWTYDGAQVFKIQHVDIDDGTLKVKDVDSSNTSRARMDISRLEMLFECGRAVWGDVLRKADDIARTWDDSE